MKDLALWMELAVRSGSWKTFDDYHVDEASDFRSEWVELALAAFDEARSIRDRRFSGFSVLLGFSYNGSTADLDCPKKLNKALDYSPPSIYVFESGSHVLRTALSDATAIATPSFAPVQSVAYVRQWRDADGDRGSLLLLDAG